MATDRAAPPWERLTFSGMQRYIRIVETVRMWEGDLPDSERFVLMDDLFYSTNPCSTEWIEKKCEERYETLLLRASKG